MMSHASSHDTHQWMLITIHMTYEILSVSAPLYSLNSLHTLCQPVLITCLVSLLDHDPPMIRP